MGQQSSDLNCKIDQIHKKNQVFITKQHALKQSKSDKTESTQLQFPNQIISTFNNNYSNSNSLDRGNTMTENNNNNNIKNNNSIKNNNNSIKNGIIDKNNRIINEQLKYHKQLSIKQEVIINEVKIVLDSQQYKDKNKDFRMAQHQCITKFNKIDVKQHFNKVIETQQSKLYLVKQRQLECFTQVYTLGQIVQCRYNSNKFFPYSQIICLTQCLIYSLAYLHSKQIQHHDFYPTNIFYLNGRFKLINPLQISKSSYELTFNRQRFSFLSPQLIISILQEKRYEQLSEQTLYKSDIFAIAMIILEMSTLLPSSECYHEDNYNIIDHVINQRIQKVNQIYTQQLADFIKLMFEYQIENRIQPIKLAQLLHFKVEKQKYRAYQMENNQNQKLPINHLNNFNANLNNNMHMNLNNNMNMNMNNIINQQQQQQQILGTRLISPQPAAPYTHQPFFLQNLNPTTIAVSMPNEQFGRISPNNQGFLSSSSLQQKLRVIQLIRQKPNQEDSQGQNQYNNNKNKNNNIKLKSNQIYAHDINAINIGTGLVFEKGQSKKDIIMNNISSNTINSCISSNISSNNNKPITNNISNINSHHNISKNNSKIINNTNNLGHNIIPNIINSQLPVKKYQSVLLDPNNVKYHNNTIENQVQSTKQRISNFERANLSNHQSTISNNRLQSTISNNQIRRKLVSPIKIDDRPVSSIQFQKNHVKTVKSPRSLKKQQVIINDFCNTFPSTSYQVKTINYNNYVNDSNNTNNNSNVNNNNNFNNNFINNIKTYGYSIANDNQQLSIKYKFSKLNENYQNMHKKQQKQQNIQLKSHNNLYKLEDMDKFNKSYAVQKRNIIEKVEKRNTIDKIQNNQIIYSPRIGQIEIIKSRRINSNNNNNNNNYNNNNDNISVQSNINTKLLANNLIIQSLQDRVQRVLEMSKNVK